MDIKYDAIPQNSYVLFFFKVTKWGVKNNRTGLTYLGKISTYVRLYDAELIGDNNQ